MGVNGLWTLISPVARPIKLETMGNKRLAIDSSIWLYQFQNAMRDKEGRALTNAHILGFLRRICKLLFYGIKPVFVFDGGAPVLKRMTIGERKKRKRGGQESLAKTAEKLLAAQMRQAAIKEAQKHAKVADAGEIITEDAQYLDDSLDFVNRNVVRRRTDTDAAKESPSKSFAGKPTKAKYVAKDQYALPVLDGSIEASAKPSDPRLATEAELRDFIEDMRPEDFDMDSSIFQALPTEVKYEIIGDLRIKSRQQNRKRVEEMSNAPTALDFSKAQIENLMQRNDLTMKLLSVTDAIAKNHVTIPVKIAAQRSREYVLVKNDASNGGGWVLGIRDGITNPLTEGSKSAPVKIDGTTTEEDSDTNDGDFEEVPVPRVVTKLPTPDPEYRTRQTIRAIQQRYGPENVSEDLEVDPDFDATPEEGGRTGSKPLFQSEDEEEHEDVMKEIANEIEAYELQQAMQASLDPRSGMDESELDTNLGLPETPISSAGRQPVASGSGMNLEEWNGARAEAAAAGSSKGKGRMVLEEINEAVPSAVEQALAEQEDEDESDEEFEEVEVTQAGEIQNSKKEGGKSGIYERLLKSAARSIPQASVSTSNPTTFPSKSTLAPQPVPVVASRSISPLPSRSKAISANAPIEFVVTPRLEKSRSRAKRTATPSPPPSQTRHDEPVNVGIVDQAKEERPAKRLRGAPAFASNDTPTKDVEGASVALPATSRLPPEVEPTFLSRKFLGFPSAPEPARASEPLTNEQPPLSPSLQVPPPVLESALESALPEENLAPASGNGSADEDDDEEIPWSRSPTPAPRQHPSAIELADIQNFPFADFGHELSSGEEMPNENIETANNIQEESQGWSSFLSQLQNRNLDELRAEVDAEVRNLSDQRVKDRRNADDITLQMSKEIQVMLRLFGIPYVVAPMEAEAQCAELLSRSLVDGIITDDSDVFLFGGSRVYKNMFNQNKYVECYLLSDLERELSLDREKLVRLAYLLGSDYVDGLPGVGPVTAMEVMREFPGREGLLSFRDWWKKVQTGKDGADESTPFRRKFRKNKDRIWLEDTWPNPAVLDAYYFPSVDESEQKFTWGIPDLDGLRQYLMEHLSWSSVKTDELLIPIIKRQTQRIGGAAHTQGVLDSFFDLSAGSGTFAPRQRTGYQSARLQNIVNEWRETQKGKASASGGPNVREEEVGKKMGQVKPVVRGRVEATEEASPSTSQPKIPEGNAREEALPAKKPRRPRPPPISKARKEPKSKAVAKRGGKSATVSDTPEDSEGVAAAEKGKTTRRKKKKVSYVDNDNDQESDDGDEEGDYVPPAKGKGKAKASKSTNGKGKGKASEAVEE